MSRTNPIHGAIPVSKHLVLRFTKHDGSTFERTYPAKSLNDATEYMRKLFAGRQVKAVAFIGVPKHLRDEAGVVAGALRQCAIDIKDAGRFVAGKGTVKS